MRVPPYIIQRFLPNRIRMHYYEAIAAQMRHGLNVLATLKLLRRRVAKGAWLEESLLGIAVERIESGTTLGQAFKDCIPNMEYMLIAAGDCTSHQSNNLSLVVEINRKRASIIKAIWTALGYSIFLYILFFALLITVAFYVVPAFLEILPLPYWRDKALTLYHVSDFVSSYKGLTLLAMLLLACVLVMYSLPRWTGTGRALIEDVPPYSLYRIMISSTWLLSLGSMLNGGIHTADALAISQKISNSPWLSKHLEVINANYAAGRDLGQAIMYAGTFLEKDIKEEIAIYASLPNFSEKLPQLAQHWLDVKITAVQKISKRLNTFGIFSVLGLLVFVILAVQELVDMISSNPNVF